jgi:2-oxoglutarate dehydrogenase E2 component (dihydrolipoamide succinyltransferase)
VSEITIPSLGIGMTDALLVRWLKQPGDAVAEDEPVAEIETDKTTMDLVSPSAGELGPHLHEPGAVIAVGDVVVRVLSAGNGTAGPARQVDEPTVAEPPSPAPSALKAEPTATAERRPHALSPRARRLAQERAATEAVAAAPEPTQRGGRFRELIAAKVSESWQTIPHFAVTREIDAEPMQAALASWRAEGITATLTDVLLRALALAHRDCGASGPVGLGLAVATDNGVVIPVIADVLQLSPRELAAARFGAVERARNGRLNSDDLNQTPVSTLSNLGSKGIDSFTGVIALGQPTLLTVGRALQRFHPGEGGTIAIRSTIIATLNVDHRVLDGADAADLLVAFAQNAEDVNRLGSEGGATA